MSIKRFSMHTAINLLRGIDMPLCLLIITLLCIGICTLYSAGDENIHLVKNQVATCGIGLILLPIIARTSPRFFYHWAPFIYAATSFLLIVVLVAGITVKGAPRWISLGLFRFQPSELMKLSMPLMLAWYLDQNRLPPNFKTLISCFAIMIPPIVLVLIEPDLGTSIMITLSALSVIYLAGIHWGYILGGALSLIASLPIAWQLMHPYQKDRVLTFINPESDPLGAGYHIIQSKIAIGSGGFSGRGWLNGTQGHLHFLPEHTTDFIFSLFGEEFGFMGAIFLISLYLLITYRSISISQAAQSNFSRLLAGGLALSFFLSMVVNIAMVSGLLPVVGVPLPMMSRGGTSMLMWLCFFGMIMAIKNEHKSSR